MISRSLRLSPVLLGLIWPQFASLWRLRGIGAWTAISIDHGRIARTQDPRCVQVSSTQWNPIDLHPSVRIRRKISSHDMARVSGIESTPNPGCFLVKLSAPLSGLEGTLTGLKGQTFTPANAVFSASPELTTLLGLEGIDSVYAMELALTIHKKASAKWETVLPLVLQATCRTAEREDVEYQQFLQGLLSQASSNNSDDADTSSGQVRIRLQVSNNLPIQIEAIGFLGSTKRMKLSSPKFQISMDELMNDKEANIDFFAGRTWLDRGMRYLVEDDDADADAASSVPEEQEQLEIDEALRMEADEVTAAYSTQRLEAIVAERLGQTPKPPTVSPNSDSIDGVMDLETVDQYCDAAEHGDDNNEALIALANFVSSRRGSIPARRNALAFLGSAAGLEPLTTGTLDAVLEAIVSALVHEKSAAMRRTAGDALSDLGDARAVNPAVTALTNDRNKLVQWRAARVLGEMGDSMEVLGALKAASFDKTYAFEVAFEIKDALRKVKARVVQLQNGGTGESLPNSGPIWKQIQEGTSS